MTKRTKIAEEQILNHLLSEPKLYWQFSNRIVDEMFETNQGIWLAFKQLFSQGKTPSIISLHPLVKDIFEYDVLVNFFTKISYDTEFDQWVHFLEDEQKRKRGVKIIQELDRIIRSEKIDEMESYLHEQLLSFSNNKNEDISMRDHIQENIRHIERIQTGKRIHGVQTGIEAFDQWTGGLQMTDLNIIAGYTSQGKTAAALTMAYNASVYGETHIGFFSLEMSTLQITSRLLAIDTDIPSKEINAGRVNLTDLNKKLSKITDNRIHLPSGRGSSLDFIMGMMRYYIVRYGCKIFFIDYLQLIQQPFKKGFNNELMIAEICRTLKNFAKENDVCINLLSQLNRGERRDGGRPKLSDIRGSGQIEEAADNVIFIYRPEALGVMSISLDDETIDTKGKVFFLLDKSRNCGITKFILDFHPEIPTIENKHTKSYGTYQNSHF